MKYLAKILILVFVFSSLVYATEPADEKVQTIWIEPGISIGSIKLSTTTNELIGQIGPPIKMEGTNFIYYMEYPMMTFYMSHANYIQRRLKHVMSDEDLKKIELKPENAIIENMITFDLSARTRGNLAIGSSLKEVLDIFGDTSIRIDNSNDIPKILECTVFGVSKHPENAPVRPKEKFMGYALSLRYLTQGISFYFKVDRPDSIPRVYAIGVSDKEDCRVKKYD